MASKPVLKLYISYASRDKELIDRLAADLSKNSISVHYDRNLINDGGDWQDSLMKGISEADCVLVFITENSLKSTYVMNELGMARALVTKSEGTKLLLPVVYGEVEIPQFIRDIQVIFWKENYEEVVDRITRAVFNFVKESVPSPVTKKEGDELVPDPDTKRNYWLLKLNPNTWAVEDLKVNENTFANTHYFGKKRPEYKLFMQIKKGDLILGFATGNYQSIVCIMEVNKPVGPDTAQGEGFEMVIKQLVKPGIPVKKILHLISNILPRLDQDKKPPELFYSLSESTYKNILSTNDDPFVEYENVYQPFYLTEGNHHGTSDQLDFENDINSFATVIALKKVDPPLAIGLFGNWGSGKSFFMEKLSERIQQIADSNEAEYIKDVVQVKFNSWHYSDANLWASLITQIFESLHDYATKKQFGAEAIKAIYKDLNITSQQLEETQKKIEANVLQETVVQEKKTAVEEIIQQKKERLDIWKARDFVKLVFSDPFIQDDFENIKTQFRNEGLIHNINQIDEKLGEINTASNQVIESFKLLKNNRKGNWMWIWILAVLFAVAAWLVMGPLNGFIKEVINGAYIASGLFVIWLGNLIAKLSPYFKKINIFYKRLKSLKEKIDREKENVRLKEHDVVDQLQKELAALATKKVSLELEQKQITETRLKLETEINEIGSGKLLANFLAGKSTDDEYIKQLGIISWVRKDFAKLNDLFQKQKTVQQTETDLQVEVQIDRIVLYIDDLDRCNEDVVVKVLEAIHLLLAFPLFVVIVGVDPRWLNNALSEKYKTLFGYREEKRVETNTDVLFQSSEDNALLTGIATSYDYLEKIFQIPFALKPINKTGREKLIKYLIREEMVEDKNITDSQINASTLKQAQAAYEILNPSKEKIDESLPKDIIKETEVEKLKKQKKAKERLVFTAAELTYMQKISSLFGQTPRTINRYVNIYRIIKAHGNLKVVGDYSKEEFMPIMFVLGVIVGCSASAEEFIAAISNADDNDGFIDFIATSKFQPALKTQITPLAIDIEDMPLKDFKRNIELISRFSFRTLLK